MKRKLSLGFFLFMFLGCLSITAQTTSQRANNLNQDKGVLIHGATLKDSYGPSHYVRFYSKDLSNVEKLAALDPTDEPMRLLKLRCGTFDGKRYIGYLANVFTFLDQPKAFVTVDFNTGKVTTLAAMAPKDHPDWPTMYDMTYDFKRKRSFALGRGTKDYATSDIYEINVTTGAYTKIAELEFYAWAIASGYDGELYVIQGKPDAANKLYEGSFLTELDPDNDFVEINKTELKDGGSSIIPNYSHTMTMDHEENILYWFAMDNSGTQKLYQIDPKTAGVTKLGSIYANVFQSVDIPFNVADSRDAAGKVRDLNATSPDDETLKATLTWKNPTVTWAGNELKELHSISIARGEMSNVIATIEATNLMGKEMSWTDENAVKGTSTYYVIPHRKAGEKGLPKSIRVFVGGDMPGKVQNFATAVSGKNVTLTWEKPAASATGKKYDETTLRYNIYRNPGKIAVATDLNATTFTETVNEPFDRYTYSIMAKNQYGEGELIEAKPVAVGKAYEPTFADNFETEAQANRWTAYDNDANGKYFAYTGEKFEDFRDFRINLDAYGPVNDYLFTPAIALKKGKTYRATYDVILGSQKETHAFDFVYGQQPNNKGLTVFKSYSDVTGSVAHEMRTYTEKFTATETGDFFVGLYCKSGKSPYNGYFGLESFMLEEVAANDLAAVKLHVNVQNQVGKGEAETAKVTVKNNGLNPQSNYKVQLIREETGEVLGETTMTDALAPETTIEVAVPFTIAAAGKISMQGKVVLANDEMPQNDLTAAVEVKVTESGSVTWNVDCRNEDITQSTTEPVSFMKNYSTVETVYLSKELGKKGGDIRGIAFDYNSNDLSAETDPVDVKIYVGTTTKSDLYETSDPTSQWTPLSDLTLVYDGDMTLRPGENQYAAFVFTTPMKYNPNENVVVQVWKHGQLDNMFPALFNLYGGENRQRMRCLRYSGDTEFNFGQASYAIAGKPVAHFAIAFEVSGIEETTFVSETGNKGFVVNEAGTLFINRDMVTHVNVFDLQGRLIGSSNGEALQVKGNNAGGLYIVKATYKNGVTRSYKTLF